MRRFAFIAAAFALALQAHAQAWPTKPVRLIAPQSAGTPPDIFLRFLADRLSKKLGQQFYVDNVLGAGGLLGAQQAARAAPDGYTYFLGGVGVIASDRHMFRQLPYDPDKDFAAAAMLYDRGALALAVHPDVPAKTVAELIALAKAQPGKLSYGTDTVGVTAIPGQWFNKLAGTDIVAVPYKNPAQMVQDTIAGRTQVVFTSVTLLDNFRKAGKVRMLGVTTERRFPGLPDIPAIAEALPGYGIYGIGILFTPSASPAEVIQRFNRELDPLVKDPEYQQRLLSYGFTNTMGAGTAQSLAEFMRRERQHWDTMLRGVNIEPQ